MGKVSQWNQRPCKPLIGCNFNLAEPAKPLRPAIEHATG